jgi:DNA repair protein RadA/Sms
VVLAFDGDPRSGLRILAGGKNRFGPEGEVAWFEMHPGGLSERASGPGLIGGEREAGCATALVTAGRRGLAIDVQALVIPSEGPPRRQVAGLDPRRFHIVAAVADRAAGLRLTRAELIGATAGGMRVDDPAADLAVAAALVSASIGVPVPDRTGYMGEVSLTGAIRPVGSLEQRLQAASAAGLERVVCSADEPRNGARSAQRSGSGGVRLVPVGHLRDALAWDRADLVEAG